MEKVRISTNSYISRKKEVDAAVPRKRFIVYCSSAHSIFSYIELCEEIRHFSKSVPLIAFGFSLFYWMFLSPSFTDAWSCAFFRGTEVTRYHQRTVDIRSSRRSCINLYFYLVILNGFGYSYLIFALPSGSRRTNTLNGENDDSCPHSGNSNLDSSSFP